MSRYTVHDEWLALSCRQPWIWAMVVAGKGIENRPTVTHYRGPLILHASSGCTMSEHHDGVSWMQARGLVRMRSRELTRETASLPLPPELADMKRGGFYAVTEIVGVIPAGGQPEDAMSHARDFTELHRRGDELSGVTRGGRRLTWDLRWWMRERDGVEQHGILVAGTRPLPFMPAPGSLGLFRVPPEAIFAWALPHRRSLYVRSEP